jgi:hypothetical protein
MKRTKFFPVACHNVWDKTCEEKTGVNWYDLIDETDGVLNSLHYYREIPEDIFVLYDCGGWTYREMEIPPIDSKSISEEYKKKCNPNSMVIAPDHMLIPGVDLNFRRKWNKEQAAQFIDDCPDHLIPMAAVHGMTIEERLNAAYDLLKMGYKHLAIGGIAGRAKEKDFIIDLVSSVRREIDKSIWVHVLGITGMNFYKKWCEIGIDSCDGSTHIHKGVLGKYLFWQNGKLVSYDCKQPTSENKEEFLLHVESICQAPKCDCKACKTLNELGIDTREFPHEEIDEIWRKEKKYGRVHHNINQIIKAQKETYQKLKKDNENK